MASNKKSGIPALTAHIVEAYVNSNHIPISELPALIADVSAVIKGLSGAHPRARAIAHNPGKTVYRDYIICLEDGRRFRTLKRHRATHYSLTPHAYRQKWGLPTDYPIVAPNYATLRSELAKKSGLGKVKSAATKHSSALSPL